MDVSVRIAAPRTQITAGCPPSSSRSRRMRSSGPHPDGERFVMVHRLPAAFKGDRVEAIINWSDAVEARVSGR